jgi:hypothetical protein
MTPGLQTVVGVLIAVLGSMGLLTSYRPLAAMVYPIIWWGLLLALDGINAVRWKQSPMRRDARHFIAITTPLSVLYWVLYEYLNFVFPQWRYEGYLPGTTLQVVFAFVSFATVIPIIVEFQWLLIGPSVDCTLPGRWSQGIVRWRYSVAACGVFLLLLPTWSTSFWLNQSAWIAPAIALLPWAVKGNYEGNPRAVYVVPAASLLSGFTWELMNHWALTKWVYTIHPEWPRLFQMPFLGYLGFIPFGYSTLVLYTAQRRLPLSLWLVIALYAAAIAALYGIVLLYRDSNFWREIAFTLPMPDFALPWTSLLLLASAPSS